VEFAPGGLRVMLMNVPPLQIGETVPLRLRFTNAGTVSVDAKVEEIETP
jgi:copper(I)-binding protein